MAPSFVPAASCPPPRLPRTSPPALRVPRLASRPIGPGAIVARRYRLVACLHRGLGDVWRAEDLRAGVDVALKLLGPDAWSDGDASQDRLAREAELGARLARATRHVVRVLDFGACDHGPFVVMELVRGPTLRRLVNVHGAIAPSELVPLFDHLAEALAAAHALGVVHRDVKPENLLLGYERGEVVLKLADFGIALAPDAAAAGNGGVVGTPGYMAPEQIRGEDVDGRADVWSAGVVAFEALAARHAIAGKGSMALLSATLRAPRLVLAEERGLPRAIDAWLERACAADRAERFATIDDAARELARALEAPSRRGDVRL